MDWLNAHGYTIANVIMELGALASALREEGEELNIIQLFRSWEDEYGFDGEIWACADEFLDEEYRVKSYIKKLLPKEWHAQYLEDLKALREAD